MWIRVSHATTEWVEGTLESTPFDMPLLPRGSRIKLPRTHVIDVIFDEGNVNLEPKEPPLRQYWDRCMVDQCVLDSELTVGYLYREEPNMGKPDDKFPDSGWRIRGDMRGATRKTLDCRKHAYIALGKVLNEDDSWIHLIDEPIGARFEKNYTTGIFERISE